MKVGTFDEYAVLVAFLAPVLFLIGYTLSAPWWRYQVGRAQIALDVGLAIALAPSALHYLVSLNLQHPFFAWYYGTSLYGVGLITLWRLWVVVHIQRKGHRSSWPSRCRLAREHFYAFAADLAQLTPDDEKA